MLGWIRLGWVGLRCDSTGWVGVELGLVGPQTRKHTASVGLGAWFELGCDSTCWIAVGLGWFGLCSYGVR